MIVEMDRGTEITVKSGDSPPTEEIWLRSYEKVATDLLGNSIGLHPVVLQNMFGPSSGDHRRVLWNREDHPKAHEEIRGDSINEDVMDVNDFLVLVQEDTLKNSLDLRVSSMVCAVVIDAAEGMADKPWDVTVSADPWESTLAMRTLMASLLVGAAKSKAMVNDQQAADILGQIKRDFARIIVDYKAPDLEFNRPRAVAERSPGLASLIDNAIQAAYREGVDHGPFLGDPHEASGLFVVAECVLARALSNRPMQEIAPAAGFG